MVLPTSARETRQAWKGATVAVPGVWQGLFLRYDDVGQARELPILAKRTTRFSAALVFLVSLVGAGQAFGQSQPTQGQMRDDGVVIIDTPPQTPSPQAPKPVPSEGVILQRPGRVLLSGKPVRLDFRSATDGVAFQLQAGGVYSSISGVSYGVGFGGWGYGGWGYGGWGYGGWGYPGWGYPGWGYPGWGYGGYAFGMAPYYGEVVTRAYQPICEAPCQATLLSGTHRMSLSLRGGAPVDVRQPVTLTKDAIVEGRYVDKSRLRKTGWAVFVSGAIAGMAMMFASIDYRYDPFVTGNQIRNPGVFYTGVGLFAGSIITGAVLAAQDDEAYINVYPTR